SFLRASILMLFAGAAAAAEPAPLLPKQLAGPASEFEAMRAPDPAAAAILSRSALLPVEFDAAGRAELRLPLHAGRLDAMLLSGGEDGAPELVSPGGVVMPRAQLARHAQPSRLGGEHDGHAGTVVRMDGLVRGDWTLRLQSPRAGGRRGYLLLKGGDGLELASHQVHRRQLVGERMDIAGMLVADDGARAALGREAGTVRSAQLRIVAPDGAVTLRPMFDDGRHGDGAAGDGRYAGAFVPTTTGTWIAQMVVRGHDRAGTPFVRTAEHALEVIAPGPRLAAPAATARYASRGRLEVALPLERAKPGAHYRVLAEVWGRDGKGGEVPVAWIGGMAAVDAGRLALGLDERWIARAGASAPFELRALRIEDPDHFIPLATADRVPL